MASCGRFERILLFCHQVPTIEVLDGARKTPWGNDRLGNLRTTMHMIRDGVGSVYLRETLGIPIEDVVFNLLPETYGFPFTMTQRTKIPVDCAVWQSRGESIEEGAPTVL
jgi:hypothetical protein